MRLEDELQSVLDLAWTAGLISLAKLSVWLEAGDHIIVSGVANLTEGVYARHTAPGKDVSVDLIATEVCMVKGVESLHSELDLQALSSLEVLVERQVGVEQLGSLADSAGSIAHCADLEVIERKGGRVKDLVTVHPRVAVDA